MKSKSVDVQQEDREVADLIKQQYELVMYKVREPEIVYGSIFYPGQDVIRYKVDDTFCVTSRYDGTVMGGYMFRVGDNYVFAFVREV